MRKMPTDEDPIYSTAAATAVQSNAPTTQPPSAVEATQADATSPNDSATTTGDTVITCQPTPQTNAGSGELESEKLISSLIAAASAGAGSNDDATTVVDVAEFENRIDDIMKV